MDINQIKDHFLEASRNLDFCSMRLHDEFSQNITMRKNVLEPLSTSEDRGYMVTVMHKGGYGYAASPDLTQMGIRKTVEHAQYLAESNRKYCLVDHSQINMPHPKGRFSSPVEIKWDTISLQEKIDTLKLANDKMKIHSDIVEWSASLWRDFGRRCYWTNGGGEVDQAFDRLIPALHVTAHRQGETQARTFGGHAFCQQRGWEFIADSGFLDASQTVAEEALELLSAENCPSGKMDVLLDADQMILQIHESIGHPVELDRILGDERNYAGTSFVTLDMFGSYQYGSKILNVTYSPEYNQQIASFAFDDDGTHAEKQYIIKDGILMRPLGGTISQNRAAMEGVACTRADSWRRPTIDRMANLNIEPGHTRFDAMIAGIERGVYMKTNKSWSIDDSRNKFQFGCEWGQLIENGKLTKIVKNPNYRGISANFWRSLKMVGSDDTHRIMGTPYCGKGEPNQAVFVGHASPACVFTNIDVFGGK